MASIDVMGFNSPFRHVEEQVPFLGKIVTQVDVECVIAQRYCQKYHQLEDQGEYHRLSRAETINTVACPAFQLLDE